MNWYLVKLVFQILNGNTSAQFDEQLRLVWADEADWAVEKASVLGVLEQTTFKNIHGVEVELKFIDVADIQKVSKLSDGVQLFSATVEPRCPNEYKMALVLNATKALHLIKAEECTV